MEPSKWYDLKTIDGRVQFSTARAVYQARYGSAYFEMQRDAAGEPAFARMLTGTSLAAAMEREQKRAGFKARVEALRRGKCTAK